MRKIGTAVRRPKLGRTAVLFAGFLGMLAIPVIANANSVAITGSMEGAIKIANGDFVSGGYVFEVKGNHSAMKVYMQNASIVFHGSCSNGSSQNTLTLPLKAGPYNVAANDNNWQPTGDETSSVGFEGSITASVCGGSGELDASSGASFSGDLQSDVTANQVDVRFHYRDPNAKGKGNYDCSAQTYSASTCGASWSGTATLKPDTVSTSTTTSNTCTTSTSTTTTNTCTTSTTTSNTCTTSTNTTTTNTCSTTTSLTSRTTTSSTTSNTTTTSTVKGTKRHRHKCAKGKVLKHGKCVAKAHKKLSRPGKGGHGFTG
jgi:hypothetical protein